MIDHRNKFQFVDIEITLPTMIERGSCAYGFS